MLYYTYFLFEQFKAQRVANELNSPLGSLVGFRIGMQQNASESTKILYVTTGWLLQRLISRPKFLFSLSHLILVSINKLCIFIYNRMKFMNEVSILTFYV